MSKLKSKIAVITGGASGIGLATARRFVAEGAFVYLVGRRQEALEAAVTELGDSVRAIQGDITDPASLDKLYETIRSETGRIDILFANAGVGDFAPLGEITEKQFDWTFDINVKGTLFTVQKALPLMSSGGTIIVTGSTVGSMGTPAMSVYSASKAAIRNFVRTWALDLRGTGIRVNVLSPGATETETLMNMGKEVTDGLAVQTPMGRLGDPSEIAGVAAFLASDDSSFMTGSEVFVDGGYAQV